MKSCYFLFFGYWVIYLFYVVFSLRVRLLYKISDDNAFLSVSVFGPLLVDLVLVIVKWVFVVLPVGDRSNLFMFGFTLFFVFSMTLQHFFSPFVCCMLCLSSRV